MVLIELMDGLIDGCMISTPPLNGLVDDWLADTPPPPPRGGDIIQPCIQPSIQEGGGGSPNHPMAACPTHHPVPAYS